MAAVSDFDLKYYILSCVTLTEEDVNSSGKSFVTVAGSWLNITSPRVINNNVSIISVKITATSSILVVDKLLESPGHDHDTSRNVSHYNRRQ